MREIVKVEHVWCANDDRWIYIETYQDGEIGLNFMQGHEYEFFKEEWCKVDAGLSNFYREMKGMLGREKNDSTELEFINTVMWVYHSAMRCWDDNQVKK